MWRAARLVAIPSALFALTLAATPTAAASSAVTIEGTAFKPASITINAGDTVTWANLDAAAHTVTSNSGVWDSGTVRGNGGTFTRVFDAAGTFDYFCHLHAWMLGTVVVLAPGASAPPTRAAATQVPAAPLTRPPLTAQPVAAVAAPTVALPERAAAAPANEGAPGPVFVALASVLIAGFLSAAWLLVRTT